MKYSLAIVVLLCAASLARADGVIFPTFDVTAVGELCNHGKHCRSIDVTGSFQAFVGNESFTAITGMLMAGRFSFLATSFDAPVPGLDDPQGGCSYIDCTGLLFTSPGVVAFTGKHGNSMAFDYGYGPITDGSISIGRFFGPLTGFVSAPTNSVPTPEPSTLTLMGVGFSLLAGASLMRKRMA